MSDLLEGLNRTGIGLKVVRRIQRHRARSGLNRTIIGLKYNIGNGYDYGR